jgi:hypothetical protein
MSGAIPPPQYAFVAWYLVKAQGQLLPLPLLVKAVGQKGRINENIEDPIT